MLAILLDKLHSALRSHLCSFCGGEHPPAGRLFCDGCRHRLSFREPEPVIEMPDFTGYAATCFNAPLKRLIYGYKFYDRQQDAPLLADILADYWEQVKDPGIHPENVTVMTVPPHGRNPGHLTPLARRFARRFGYEYEPLALRWRRDTRPQHLLEGRKARFENMTGSLQLNPNYEGAPRQIILVDDLTTTGATIHEAVRALLEGVWPHPPELKALAISQVVLDY